MRKLTKIFICAFAAVALLSCSKEQIGDPFMLFEIYGKVMDVDGNPLQGINVIAGQADVQTTNLNGDFTFFVPPLSDQRGRRYQYPPPSLLPDPQDPHR